MGYWRNLQERERLSLLIGAAVLVLILGYLMVWQPVAGKRAQLRVSVADQQELLAWMHNAADEVKRQRLHASAAGSGSGQSLLSRVETTARQAGLAKSIRRIQPGGSDEVRVWLDAVAFDDMLTWLRGLVATGDLVTKDLAVDKTETPGVVNLRLVLQGTRS